MTLNEAVKIAKEKSIASLQVATRKENSYWQWRVFKSGHKPQLFIDGSLLDFNRTFQSVIQPDGNILFQPISNNNATINLTMTQRISSLGTELFLQSQLHRFNDFDGDFIRYSSNPFVLGLRQPLFTFNQFKWDKVIEPLRYEESLKTYIAELEDIAKQTNNIFFDLLLAQINYEVSEINLANSDTILAIGRKRYTKGNIFKNDLLQLQLAKNRAEKTLLQTELALENSSQRFKEFIGVIASERIKLVVPADTPLLEVDESIALSQARLNRPEILYFERQKHEAKRDVAKAKGDNGLNIDIVATFGLSNRADNLSGVYRDLNPRETFRLGFSAPILDWGRSKSVLRTAMASQKLIEYTIQLGEVSFRQEIFDLVRQFNTMRLQLKITGESDKIAIERYDIAKQRYLSNDISFTELNIAQSEKDQAKSDYISALRSFWAAYFDLRYLTLYDFEKGIPLNAK